jgi:hypothetical protein
LLLVVLLPLSGCLDTVEPAGAESNDDDSIEAIVHSSETLTLHLQAGENQTSMFNGTTVKLEAIWVNFESGFQMLSAGGTFSMNCSDGVTVESAAMYAGYYLPILGEQECELILESYNHDKETIYVFSSYSVAALEAVN